MTEIILASLVVFAAYFLKSFTGFGPAMIMIPFLAIIFDPSTAIITSTVFDFWAGLILLISVRKKIQWYFVFSIFIPLAFGAIFGSFLLGTVSDYWIKKLIGITILVFAIIILFQKEGNSITQRSEKFCMLRYPIGAFGGFLGGFMGITGPPIIIFLKMLYDKSFFRTQLISIFFFGSAWRFMLYRINGIAFNMDYGFLAIFFIIMLLATWIGTHLHFKVNETIFNRIVAILLVVPAFNLIFNT